MKTNVQIRNEFQKMKPLHQKYVKYLIFHGSSTNSKPLIKILHFMSLVEPFGKWHSIRSACCIYLLEGMLHIYRNCKQTIETTVYLLNKQSNSNQERVCYYNLLIFLLLYPGFLIIWKGHYTSNYSGFEISMFKLDKGHQHWLLMSDIRGQIWTYNYL